MVCSLAMWVGEINFKNHTTAKMIRNERWTTVDDDGMDWMLSVACHRSEFVCELFRLYVYECVYLAFLECDNKGMIYCQSSTPGDWVSLALDRFFVWLRYDTTTVPSLYHLKKSGIGNWVSV